FTGVGNFAQGSGGTTVNAAFSDPAGKDLLLTAGSSLQNNGHYVQFQFSTQGLAGVKMSLAAFRSGTGFSNDHLLYSTDGINFTSFAAYNPPISTNATYSLKSFDLSTVPALDDQIAVYLRLTVDTATNAGGTNHFDNVQISASTPTPTAIGGGLALFGFIA